jgi:DNA-damage-inducible protein D
VVTQRTANPCTPVRFRLGPPIDDAIEHGKDYAMLSNIMSTETFCMGVEHHKRLKGLSSQNLRDHMINLEPILTMLGEISTTEITSQKDA